MSKLKQRSFGHPFDVVPFSVRRATDLINSQNGVVRDQLATELYLPVWRLGDARRRVEEQVEELE